MFQIDESVDLGTRIEVTLENIGILKHLKKILESGNQVTCYDVNLISIQEVSKKANSLNELRVALERRLVDIREEVCGHSINSM